MTIEYLLCARHTVCLHVTFFRILPTRVVVSHFTDEGLERVKELHRHIGASKGQSRDWVPVCLTPAPADHTASQESLVCPLLHPLTMKVTQPPCTFICLVKKTCPFMCFVRILEAQCTKFMH